MAHHNAPVVRNYTQTALFSFAIMFFLFASLSKCSGPFVKSSSHHAATHDTHKEANAEHKEAPKH